MHAIAELQIQALNDAESSENRIHSDDVAARYGFSGALVSGVNLFGYLTQPLVRCYGENWLSEGVMDVIFLKPAYHEDLLSIQTENLQTGANYQRHHLSCAYNQEGVLLARLESWLPSQLPAINTLASMSGGAPLDGREEISWDLIHLQQPAASYSWLASSSDNLERVEAQRDESEIYRGENGLIHPYYLLDACNQTLKRMFILPAWIHTGSRLVLRRAIRTGQTIEVCAIPIQKWTRKGHQFIKLYIAMRVDGEVALEVEHSAIFRIAS